MLRRFRFGQVSWREWLGLCAAALAVVSAFLNWTVLSGQRQAVRAALAGLPYESTHRAAFDSGIYAWIPLVLIVLVGLTVVAMGQFRTLRGAGFPQLWLVVSAVALALMIIGLFAMRGQFGEQASALLAETGVVTSAGFGRWLGIGAAAVSLLAAIIDVFAMRTEIPQHGRKPKSAPRR